MARGKQVSTYVPLAQVEAFDQMVEESGQTAYLFLAGLIEKELRAKGVLPEPKQKKLNFEGTSLQVPVQATARRRRRHGRRQSS